MTASYWQQHGKSTTTLPPVSSILSLSADHFNSDMFHGSSFLCEESLQSSPSTSMGSMVIREPLRTRQILQQPNTDSAVYHHSAAFEQHRQIKHATSSPAIFSFARKRRSVQLKLDQPQRQYVYVSMDEVIHKKDKPLQRLIESQQDYLPSLKNLRKLQKEITPEFRKNAVQWLEEVCVEGKCDVIVFPLAINLMDRFLSKKFVPKMHLQALASACLLIAGKVKAPIPLQAKTIAYYTDGAVTCDELLEWELAVTATLNWEFYAPTAFEFYDQILSRKPEFSDLRQLFQRHCYRLLQDEKLACQKPCLQAAYCIGYSAVEAQDKRLYVSAYFLIKDLFGISKQVFNKGVNALNKLVKGDSQQEAPAQQGSPASVTSSVENYQTADEGSPNKIQKIEEPQHLVVQESPERMAFSPLITSSTAAIVGTSSSSSRMYRSQSTAFYYTSSSPMTCQDIRKTHSSNSLQRTSFSDDSGFQSEVSSPECSRSTMTSPTTTIAGRKVQKAARRNRPLQQQVVAAAPMLRDCFYQI